MHDPDVLILDEPTSGLDPLMQNEFVEFLKEEKARGKTLFLSSHIFHEVDVACDRLSIIKEGHIASEIDLNERRKAEGAAFDLERYFMDFYRDDLDTAKTAAPDEAAQDLEGGAPRA